MQDRHIAVYGSVQLERGYCNQCKTTAFIIDNQLQCCNQEVDTVMFSSLPVTGIAEASSKRKHISSSDKNYFVNLHDNRCFYCKKPFGSFYQIGTSQQIRKTKMNSDHAIPFTFSERTTHNMIVVCNICNAIKGNKIFNSITSISAYCRKMIRKKKIRWIS